MRNFTRDVTSTLTKQQYKKNNSCSRLHHVFHNMFYVFNIRTKYWKSTKIYSRSLIFHTSSKSTIYYPIWKFDLPGIFNKINKHVNNWTDMQSVELAWRLSTGNDITFKNSKLFPRYDREETKHKFRSNAHGWKMRY